MDREMQMADAIPACRQCGKPSPAGDPCDRCKLDNLADFMIEETLAMTDEEIMAETSPAEIENVKAILARAINDTRAHLAHTSGKV